MATHTHTKYMSAAKITTLVRWVDGTYFLGPDGGLWSAQGPLDFALEQAVKELLQIVGLYKKYGGKK